MAMEGHICDSAPLQFPKPSRPIQSYHISSELDMPKDSFEHHFRDQCYEHATPSSTYTESTHRETEVDDDLLRILKEYCVEEVDEKSRELFKKIFAKLEKENRETLEDPRVRSVLDLFEKLSTKVVGGQVNLDRGVLNAPRTKQKGLKVDSTSTRQELLHKLERFKVKTVDLGQIVKEDKK